MAEPTMRAPLSIALRLGLLFAAIAAAVFVAVGAYLYQTLSMQMGRRDDLDLLNKAALVRQLLRTLPAGERGPRQLQMVLGQAIGQDGVMLEVRAADDATLVSTVADPDALASLAAVPAARPATLADIASRAGRAGPARVLRVLAGTAGGAMRVTLVRVRSDRLAVLKRYAFDLLGALGAGVLLATALGFAAVRRGLRPLRRFVAEANAINARRLDTRLPAAEMPPELRELCTAFNAMLDRLEDGVQRLSGFAADLAHDLRTPVNALMMQTQVALSRPRTVEEYQALLASVQDEYERLARMIENTLFLARADNAQLALRPAELDLGAELEHIREYFEFLADDAGVALALGELPPAARLHADPVLLRRAVNNLVSNAIAHTPAGGRVTLGAAVDGPWLALTVANTGEGIAPALLAQVFERYYRADPARPASAGVGGALGNSMGLGLAIVRAIMRLHGGDAQAASADGLTVFTLRFPRQA